MAKLKTGRHTSALKAHRQSEKKRTHNKGLKKRVKTTVKELTSVISSKDKTKAAELLKLVSSRLDKAAKSGGLHWKTAARKKSRLAKRVAKTFK
jgi:small subunit ribosomal protein S20